MRFGYDYMGRRVEKRVYVYDGGDWTLERTRRVVYWGWLPLLELDCGAGVPPVCTVVKQFTWGLDLAQSLGAAGGIGGLLACRDPNDPADPNDPYGDFAYFYDAGGNVTQLVGVSASAGYGQLAARYEYDPYGNLLLDVGSDSASGGYAPFNAMRFSTKAFDEETTFGNWGRRYFGPTLGRWGSRDPIGERGGLNLFRYASNEPTDRSDAFGLQDPGWALRDERIMLRDLDEYRRCQEARREFFGAVVLTPATNLASITGGVSETVVGVSYWGVTFGTDPFGFGADMIEHGTDTSSTALYGLSTNTIRETQYAQALMSQGYSPLAAGFFDAAKDARGLAIGAATNAIKTLASGLARLLAREGECTLGKLVVREARHCGPSPWSMPLSQRGELVEDLLGKNTPRTFDKIDIWEDGIATSIKSIDPRLPSYLDPARFRAKIQTYIEMVAKFTKAERAGLSIAAEQVRMRALRVGLPKGAVTDLVRRALEEAAEYAKKCGVTLEVYEIR